MKTNQLILAAALVALAACNKESFDPSGPNTLNDEIGFTAVTKKATKANDAIITGTTYATDDNNSFKVWGWQSEKGDFSEFAADAASNFMSNLTIEWTGGRDSRTPAWRNADNYYYWPFTGKISFLAIHPSTVAPSTTGWDADNDVPKATINDYTVVGRDSTDLMFANAAGSRRADALPIVFSHALSQIEVQVKTDVDYSADNVVFDVESVTFNNIDLSGDAAYSNDAIAWTDNTDQDQNWIYYNTVLANIDENYQVYGAAKVNIPQPANILVIDTPAVGDPGDPGYVPATYSDDVQTTLTIGYSMKQGSNAKITGTVTIADPFLSVDGNAWQPGKKYNYTINFRLNEITFNPSVTDWVDVNVTTINIY